MDLSHPIKSVIPSAYGDVLVVVARTTEPLTGRRIAALTNGAVSQPRVNAILGELAAAGVVDRNSVGNAHLYVLNRDHLAADAIEQLVSIRSRLIEAIFILVSEWAIAPASVWMFGSGARGEGSATSDIDVLVVRPEHVDEYSEAWESQIHDLEAQVTRWTGNDCRVIQYSPDEIDELDRTKDPLLVNVRADGLRIVGGRRSLHARVGQ